MAVRRTVPIATAALVAVTIAAYAAELAGGGLAVCERFGFVPAHPSPITAVTSVFLHDPRGLTHIAGNMVALAVLGMVVEPVLGHGRFLALFLSAGLGAAVMDLLAEPGSAVLLVGASGALCGLMTIGAILKPRALLAFVASYITLNLLALYITTPLVPSESSVVCHIGGFICGAVVAPVGRALAAIVTRRASIA